MAETGHCAISWDGILCKSCRQFFDSQVVGREEAMEEVRTRNGSEFQRSGDKQELHSMATIKRCAGSGCHLCALVLANFEQPPDKWARGTLTVDELAGYDVTLYAWIVDPDPSGCTVYIIVSWEDPRPVSEQTAEYRKAHMTVEFREVPAKMNPYKLSSTNTSSDETFRKIERWLGECLENHAACSRWPLTTGTPAGLPTRLLQVTPASQPLAIRLVATQDLQPASCRYVTLSHSWGKEPLIKLVKSSIERFSSLSGIPWHLMPLTFQQAVSVTRRLGLAYIWIDALCIIQDSDEDWRYESARMTSVYANCYLNLSADASTDGAGGLFRDREPSVHRTFIVPSSQRHGDDNGPSYCCYIPRWLEQVERAPLKGRAWVTQERFLSPRILHFSADQAHWECVEVLTSEGAPDGFFMDSATFSKTDAFSQGSASGETPEAAGQKIQQLWHRLIDAYSHAQLTFISDRPIAVAGLASTFSHFLGLEPADYLCGLWRPRFVQSLMWMAYWGPGRAPDAASPSWSWLSVRGNARQPRSHHLENVAEFVSCHVVPSGNPFGPVLSARASVRAPVCEVWVDVLPEPFDYCGHADQCSATIQIGDITLREGESFFLKLDGFSYINLNDDSLPNLQDVVETPSYLLLGQGGVDRPPKTRDRSVAIAAGDGLPAESDDEHHHQWDEFYGVGHYECLILKPTEQPGEFRRIGFVKFDGPTSQGWKCCSTGNQPDCCAILGGEFRGSVLFPNLFGAADEKFMYTITLV